MEATPTTLDPSPPPLIVKQAWNTSPSQQQHTGQQESTNSVSPPPSIRVVMTARMILNKTMILQ